MTDETREQIRNDADAAFNEKRGGNIHFWTAKDDEPEVIFWKETWSSGATNQHPISYEAGRKAERNYVIDEALKIVRVTSIAWVKDERDFEMIRTIKEKLEALKKKV